ncbi:MULTISPECIES: universal stress protein [Cellulomonas]|uniref:UspA domain-containing protein n=1 Tax=Cellulomonas gilvus (strain ATCC 13127 / NRRL B-14078) TaxID=593907 RepID=F8A3Q9_CELGA|nr:MULTISPECIES: universal stress protein [Cellulomonas]AEI11962.1 UspA domain-containing protein [Cellulomonas gilvus ATCC 13127]MCR6690258.1 universal stress protein [Cellulomonas sp.]
MGIVVGYLATPEGRAALDVAVQEGAARGRGVVVVVSMRSDESAEQRAAVEAELARVGEDLRGRGIEHEVRILDGGDVADDLIATAEETGAELVVIGLRRRSPVGKLILGANAQRVLFDAPCPVLTVKPAAS